LLLPALPQHYQELRDLDRAPVAATEIELAARVAHQRLRPRSGLRLGHSSISITLDRYSHVVEGMDKEAVETVAAMIKESG
jgi:hypothetical protein